MNYRDSPLHEAAFDGNLELIRKLLDQGMPIETVNALGDTCLHYAVMENKIDAVKLLLQRGANVNHQSLPRMNGNKPTGGFTPLMVAVHCASPELVALLLQAGADPYMRNAQGYNSLDKAIQFHQNNPNAGSPNSQYPKKIAILEAHLDSLKK